jgi:hypothetical protein
VRGRNSFGNGFDLSRQTRKNILSCNSGAATYPGPEDLFLLNAASRAEFRFFERPLTFRRRGDKVSLCNVLTHLVLNFAPLPARAKIGQWKGVFASFLSACAHMTSGLGHHRCIIRQLGLRQALAEIELETCSFRHRIPHITSKLRYRWN